MPQVAKISGKGQVTVPVSIRRLLGAEPGDRLIWEITEDGSVVVRREREIDVDYLSAIARTLSEWDSKEDDRTFR